MMMVHSSARDQITIILLTYNLLIYLFVGPERFTLAHPHHMNSESMAAYCREFVPHPTGPTGPLVERLRSFYLDEPLARPKREQ